MATGAENSLALIVTGHPGSGGIYVFCHKREKTIYGGTPTKRPERMNIRSLLFQLLLLFCLTVWCCTPALTQDHQITNDPLPDEPGGSELSLEKAVAAALRHNPDLAASTFGARLAESEKLASSLFPNPELEFEYEDFDAPEKTLTIGYLIELGGKRRHRMEVADAGIELAMAEIEAARFEIVYETAAAFIDVLAAQENFRIAREKKKLADQVYETANEQVMAGRVSPMEQVTAEIKQNNAGLDVQNAEDALLIARTNLSARWGGSAADVNTAAGNFDQIQPVPSFEALAAAMEKSPRIMTRTAEIKVAENRLTLEKRNRIPDLTLSGGIRKTDEADDDIYIVGLSLPIPLFDRNQAGVARGAAELGQQNAALSAEKQRLTRDLNIAFQTLKSAQHQANTIKTDILPAAQSVFSAVREGYQEGAFGFLDMLEAQSTLYESHENYVHSLARYHHAVIELEKMLGQSLPGPELH